MFCSLSIDCIAFEFQNGECLWKVASKYTLKHVLRKLSFEHRLTEKTGEILNICL
jgi:hypothetical protein